MPINRRVSSQCHGRGVRVHRPQHADRPASRRSPRRRAIGRGATWSRSPLLFSSRSKSLCRRLRPRRQKTDATDGARPFENGGNARALGCRRRSRRRALPHPGGTIRAAFRTFCCPAPRARAKSRGSPSAPPAIRRANFRSPANPMNVFSRRLCLLLLCSAPFFVAAPASPVGNWFTYRRVFKSSEKRSEEHTSELQSPDHLVCRLLLEKKKQAK